MVRGKGGAVALLQAPSVIPGGRVRCAWKPEAQECLMARTAPPLVANLSCHSLISLLASPVAAGLSLQVAGSCVWGEWDQPNGTSSATGTQECSQVLGL